MTAIETERLHIRRFSKTDWQALHEMIVQYQSSEYAAYDHQWPTSPEEIKQVTEWFAGGDRFLAVCLKDTGRLVGFVSLSPELKEHCRRFNLGYCFNFSYHGRGYATEACHAALGHAFDELQADEVVAGTAAANRPSCRLLERLGLRRISEGTGSFTSTPEGKPIEFASYTFAVSRDEWELGKATPKPAC